MPAPKKGTLGDGITKEEEEEAYNDPIVKLQYALGAAFVGVNIWAAAFPGTLPWQQ